MRRRLLPILALLIVVSLAAFGLIIRKLQLPKSQNNSQEVIINQGEAQVQLVRLSIDHTTPTAGEPIVFNLYLDDLANGISAISIGLSFPYDTDTSPINPSETPFSLNQELIDAGWQILINQTKNDIQSKTVKAELAIGVLNQDKQSEIPQPFAQLILPTNTQISSGQIVIDSIATKVVNDQGETLPVQLITEPYNILPTTEKQDEVLPNDVSTNPPKTP